MRVLVLGADGMLGHQVLEVFPDVAGTIRSRIDPTDSRIIAGVDAFYWPDVAGVIESVDPEVVVNCIGLIKQRDPDTVAAISINALLPHRLALHCVASGIRLIHISTDCVFDGKRGSYGEPHPPNAADIYGRTKALGEVTTYENTLTIRTSLIGHELHRQASLLEWFLSQDRPVNGYTRAFFSGVTTNWLADTIADMVAGHPDLVGLYNVAGDRISKYDLLTIVADVYGRPAPIPDDSVEIDRSLNGEAFTAATGIETPGWYAMIMAMAASPV